LPGPTSVDTPAFKDCICEQKFFDLIVEYVSLSHGVHTVQS
jgi:hypothetical protein